MVSVILSASVERCFVSRMRDFLILVFNKAKSNCLCAEIFNCTPYYIDEYQGTWWNSVVKTPLRDAPVKIWNFFLWTGPLGKISHRVAMSVCMFVSLIVCSWHLETPSSGGCGDFCSKWIFLILCCYD